MQYLPTQFLVLDRLVVPPGMAMDNLVLQVDMNSEEYLIQEQGKRKKPQQHMYEKAFNVKKATSQTTQDTVYSVQNGGKQKDAKTTLNKD